MIINKGVFWKRIISTGEGAVDPEEESIDYNGNKEYLWDQGCPKEPEMQKTAYSEESTEIYASGVH